MNRENANVNLEFYWLDWLRNTHDFIQDSIILDQNQEFIQDQARFLSQQRLN